ncbi:MAG TPA: GNAT family N-acetyltransferase [Pyrinomonadaceae bacterium]|nr:GNAT family N-acetyltransferase [Pyrinomonadaceae bacterium]
MTANRTILETKRLILRNWTDADCSRLLEILRDPEVVRNVDDGSPFSFEKTQKFLEAMEKCERENGFCRWKVVEKSSGELAGTCGFGRIKETNEIEIGYLFAQKHWGKGYATEIAGAALDHGFNKLGFREIIALTDLENTASQKVLEKIGFTKRGLEIIGGEENLVFIKKKSDE